ncbi:MAG: hypothetical protein JW822_03980 [Spirochaetales bacterium]|nr:hypothetical protein [Spirochaetales bacterium]
MSNKSNLNGIAEDILYLKKMIKTSRDIFAHYKKIFVVWGFINVLGGTGSFLLLIYSLAAFIPLIWILLVPVGIVFSFISGMNTARTFKINPLFTKILMALWMCSIAGIAIISLTAIFIQDLQAQYIPGLSFIILGISMISSAVLFESKAGFLLGILFFLTAVVTLLFPFYATLAQGIVIGGGLLFFGIKKNV